MEFNKYQSIDNSYNTKLIDKILMQINPKQSFVALEKIHGTNFGITLDTVSREIRFNKRGSFIGENASFYSYQKVEANLKASIKKLASNPSIKGREIQVVGELFGGDFYGETAQGSKKVQSGVYYHPNTKFMAFDLKVDGEFIYWAKAERLLKEAGFDTPPIIAVTNSFQEALEVNETFNSMVPLCYGLMTPIDTVFQPNIAEGVVIKPYNQEITLGNGKRLILKKKTDKFSENNGKKKKPKEEVNLDEVTLALFEDVTAYLTLPRIECVVSKEGDGLVAKDFGRILGLFVQDAIKDYEQDTMSVTGDTLKGILGTDDWKVFNKELVKVATKELRQVWSMYLED